MANANLGFALDLYGVAAQREGNLVIGPHSISAVMAMVHLGARGQTEQDIARVLHFAEVGSDVPGAFNALDLALRSRSDSAVDLRIANQAFAQPGFPFVEAYLASLTQDFGAPVAELDFSDAERARAVVNRWAAQRTGDRIDDLFPAGSITPSTVLVLANAVSLVGQWRYRFDPSLTSVAKFARPDGSTVDVPMMHFDYSLPLAQGADYAAVELPYGRGDLSMVLILPDNMAAFEAALSADRLQSILESINDGGIHLRLPRFSFRSDVDMDAALRELGLSGMFDVADLSGMVEGGGLSVATVQHEAFIEVDEEGTRAHAATGAGIPVSHGPTIEFNRPFFFVIRDRPSGAILFLGRVTDPTR